MPLPTFDKKEQIPTGFEDEYEERDGKWAPIDHAGELRKQVAEEKRTREAAEKAAKKAAKELAEANARSAATASGMTEEAYKKMRESLEKEMRDEYEPKVKGFEELQKENRSLKLDTKVRQMFKQGGALDGKVDDFWKLHGEEFDLTSDGKPMVKNEPGKDVARHVQAILANRKEWVQGTKASGGGSPLTTTTPSTGLRPGGLTFEDLTKNPSAAIAVANER